MSKVLDALEEYSKKVAAGNAPVDEKKPVILNLSVESNYGKYKFIPILPTGSNDVLPFITVHFNEIKLHIKGAKYDTWKKVISMKDVDTHLIPEDELELLRKCHEILHDISKMKDPEFHKVTRGNYKTKDRDTIRYKTYVIWYAYILEAKDLKGNTIEDHNKKFRLMVMPSSKMENAIESCYKTILDNYDTPLRENALESLFGGGIDNRKDYFELTIKRPKNYEIGLSPVIYQPGVKLTVPEKLISDAGYANLKHPLAEFTGGEDAEHPYSIRTIKFIVNTLLERIDPSAHVTKEPELEEDDDESEKVKDPEFKIPEQAEDPFKTDEEKESKESKEKKKK